MPVQALQRPVDLEGAHLIDTPHIAEASRYRKRDSYQQSGGKTVRWRGLQREVSIVCPVTPLSFAS